MTPIERLIGACKDDEHLLDYGRLLDPIRRDALRRLADERIAAIDQMTTAGRTLQGSPKGRRSILGMWRGLMLDLRFAVGGTNAGDVIFACRGSQRRVEERFAEALADKEWSGEMHHVLEEQHARIQDARKVLTGLM